MHNFRDGNKRHCSCGRDEAVAELAEMRAALGIYANEENWASHDGYMYLKTLSHPWSNARSALAKAGVK